MPTIEDGRSAAAQGNLQQARLIFEAILQENPRSEDAWLNLADVLTDTNDKRICYENVLKIDEDHQAAREALRNLEPEADPLRQQFQLEEAIEEPDLDGEDEEDTLVSERSEFEPAVPLFMSALVEALTFTMGNSSKVLHVEIYFNALSNKAFYVVNVQ